jgi:hypothetical protein
VLAAHAALRAVPPRVRAAAVVLKTKLEDHQFKQWKSEIEKGSATIKKSFWKESHRPVALAVLAAAAAHGALARLTVPPVLAHAARRLPHVEALPMPTRRVARG